MRSKSLNMISPLREIREERGLKQSDLALLIGEDPSKICMMEKGVMKLSPKTLDMLEKIGEEREEVLKRHAEFIRRQRRLKLADLKRDKQ